MSAIPADHVRDPATSRTSGGKDTYHDDFGGIEASTPPHRLGRIIIALANTAADLLQARLAPRVRDAQQLGLRLRRG